MNKLRMIHLGAMLFLGPLAAPFARADESKVYALKFRDGNTEGSWAFALDEGVLYEITFARNSNSKAFESLAALDPEIIRLNTSSEHNIYLVGELIEPVAAGAKFGTAGKAEMRLDGWYIKAPFYLPPLTDPDGKLRLGRVLTVANFLPAGERPDSAATLKLRNSLVINQDKRLSLFWIGASSPFAKVLE